MMSWQQLKGCFEVEKCFYLSLQIFWAKFGRYQKKSRTISHRCWSIGRRGWTCTGSSWPCPRSGCWGCRAGWRWAPASRWSPPGSPPSSLEAAFSNLEGLPQISNLKPLSLWTSETIVGSICSISLILKFESLRVIFWPSTSYHWVLLSLGQFSFLPHWTFPSILHSCFCSKSDAEQYERWL